MSNKTLIPHAVIAGMMLAAALLGGCAKSSPEEEPTTANDSPGVVAPIATEPGTEGRAPVLLPAPTVAAAKPTAAVIPPVVAEPREAPAAPDAQMLDDADATGMTARVSRNAATVNETAPQ